MVIPEMELASSRAATSRANGGLGGRPRRNETPEAARLRRSQTAMLLSVPGGAEKPEETQDEKPPITTSSSGSLSPAGGKSAREVSHSALGAELATLAGLDPVRQRFDYRPVVDWLSAGISPATIRAAVSQVAEREGYDAGKVHSLRYFTRAVEAGHAEASERVDRPISAMTARRLEWLANGCDPSTYPVHAA